MNECKINQEFNCLKCIDLDNCLNSNDSDLLSTTKNLHKSFLIEMKNIQKTVLEINKNIW